MKVCEHLVTCISVLQVSATAALEEEVGKWKTAYEQAVREAEQWRSSRGAMLAGGEKGGLDAAEWRDRFEICLAEKQALLERIDVLTGGGGRGERGLGGRRGGGEGAAEQSSSSSAADGGGVSSGVEKAYLDLKEEYREFRRKVLELEQERERRRERRRREEQEGLQGDISKSSGRGRSGGGGAAGPETNKLQYVRNLILQYLSCKDPIVREHMEQAIMAIFRFNEGEREGISERKKEENPEEAVLSSVRSLVSTLGINY